MAATVWRFNGAMASQPWILGTVRTDGRDRLALQWSHGLPAMDTRDHRNVPGAAQAASMEPWPPSHGYASGNVPSCCGRPGASMEPWPPSHGYHNPPPLIPGQKVASMEPWPPSHGYLDAEGMAHHPFVLQWSHGLPAMDTARRARRQTSQSRASMEPWPPSHGYPGSPLPVTAIRPGFNGAMASQPWIRLTSGSPRMGGSCFNGAMASQPWIPEWAD